MEGIEEVQGKTKRTRPHEGARRQSIRPHVHCHPLEVRRKAVQSYLEEGFPPELVAREMGMSRSTLSKWLRLYRYHGEAGLKSEGARSRRSQLPRTT